MRRKYGTGSVYRDAGHGGWVAAVDVPTSEGRRRKRFRRTTREAAEAALDEWLAANARPSLTTRDGRAVNMERARSRGTHTAAEWWRKVRTYGGACHYCARPWGHHLHKDHAVPVSRGGSDALDNLVPACGDCNQAKGALTDREFIAWAEATGFFRKPRARDLRRIAARAWGL